LNKYFSFYFILAVLLFCETANAFSAHDIVFPSAPFNPSAPQSASTDASRDPQMLNINYSDGSVDNNQTDDYTTTAILCDPYVGPPNEIIGRENSKITILSDSSLEHCQQLSKAAHAYEDSMQYQEAYDAYRHYIESCAYLSNSYTSFNAVTAMNSQRSNEKERYQEYREWLKKVLYFNLDTNYYCADVNQIFTTFQWFNDTRGHDYRGALTLLEYLIDSGKCRAIIPSLMKSDTATWNQVYTIWSDTVPNPDKAIFDSTLPTLDDLGLGILRGKPAEVKHFNDMMLGPLVSGLYSTPNPFTTETKISFNCREMALLKFEIYDILGKKVYVGSEQVFDKGENTITILGKDLPHGILYGRFVSLDGSAKTIKLRKTE
jgi:tetratricopeptide (TPR) repeat protein